MLECVDSYKYLGFVFHDIKGLHFGTEALTTIARKTLFAMRRRCALLVLRDPALQCKLFDTWVLPILSYGCEVWGVDAKRVAAETLHKGFLKSLLGVRKSVATHMVYAKLGRFPLQIHFWQRILRYHHRTIALDNVRLVELAIIALWCCFAIGQTAIKGSWQRCLGDFLHGHTGEQQLFHQFDVVFIIERAKHQHAFEYFTDTKLSTSSLSFFCRTLQPMYRYADYLSATKCMSNRRPVSRFRNGLRVDTCTDRWANNASTPSGRGSPWFASRLDVWRTSSTLSLICPAYSHVRAKHVDLYQHCCTVADLFCVNLMQEKRQ